MAGVKRFDFDAGLAPYDLQGYPTWQRLSGHISPRTVAALSPPSGNMSILAEADPASGRAETAAEAALAAQLTTGREAAAAAGTQVARGGEALRAEEQQQQPQQEPAGQAEPPQQPQQGQHEQQQQQLLQEQQRRWEQSAAAHAGRARYTPLPRLVKRGGLTPVQLTALNLDKSKLLEELLGERYGGSEEALLGEGVAGGGCPRP